MNAGAKSGSKNQARFVNQAMAACLSVMLESLRTQYRYIRIKADRLEQAGADVSDFYRQLGSNKKGVKAKNG